MAGPRAGAALVAASLGDYLSRTGTAYDSVEMVGFVALAPQDVAVVMSHRGGDADRELAALVGAFNGSVFDFTHLAMNLWANAAAFPNLAATDVFTDDGAKALDAIFRAKCMHSAADTISFNFGEDFKTLLKAKPSNGAAWLKAMTDGSVPPTKPAAPVIIYFGNKDTTVAPVMGKLYREQMCKLGGNVARVRLAGNQSHFTTPGASEPLFLPWVKDRFEGKPAADGCAAGGEE